MAIGTTPSSERTKTMTTTRYMRHALSVAGAVTLLSLAPREAFAQG
jgi:hypothetical protein